MSSRHGVGLRGLMSVRSSPAYEGKFGRLFRGLPAAQYGANAEQSTANLAVLGAAMSADLDAPKDGPDEEESGIPALYTYFGQFIDHDITFDPASSLQKQNDPDALVDFRTPALDLDNVYGRGPDDQPYLYDGGKKFLLGDPIGGGNPGGADLPRNKGNPQRALIGDPRNDENSIVSQLQGLFLRFHNRMATDHPELSFGELQSRVRLHYQYLVLHDFLPRIVHSSVLADLRSGHHYDRDRLKFFHPKHAPFMPVEFSVAAYRFGHSMVRPGYRLNDAVLLPIFPVPPEFPEGLTGFRAMNPAWGLDWGRFIDLDVRKTDGSADDQKKRLQFAYRIDTSLVNPLAHLPPSVASSPPVSLAQRNLERGFRLGLPNGQDVARAMRIKPLHDKEIVIGKAVDEQQGPRRTIANSPELKAFAGNCPLWTYVLAEAMHAKEDVKIPVTEGRTVRTPRLGPVGGRIVAEVFLGMLFGDPHSLLNLDPYWHPPEGTHYALKDFVKYALGD